jgi:hypothetical protein
MKTNTCQPIIKLTIAGPAGTELDLPEGASPSSSSIFDIENNVSFLLAISLL